MSFGWKTLLRVVCASALAAVMVAMPASAAKKVRHGGVAVQRVAPASSHRVAAPVRVKSSHHAESRSVDRHSQARGSHDRRHASRGDERTPSRESNRSHSRHGLTSSPDRHAYRQSRQSRHRNRRYSYQSDFSGSDFAHNITSDVKAKPAYPHGYTPRATDIAMTAMSLIGTPYRYGGNSPLTGLDCSGFVKYVYKETLDTDLPRTAAAMSRVGQPVSREELKPGDLVFYNTMRRSNSHVGIYLGDGRFIHSPRTGQRVRINSMDENYWRGRFNGARRIIGGEGIDRAKVLEEYSKQADTSPDTYNYDEDEPGNQRSTKPAVQRKAVQQPEVAEVKPSVTVQDSEPEDFTADESDSRSFLSRRGSRRGYYHRHRDSVRHGYGYHVQRRQETAHEEGRHRSRHHSRTDDGQTLGSRHHQVDGRGHDRGQNRIAGRHEAKPTRDTGRRGLHVESRKPERATAFKSIERRPSGRSHGGRRR